MRDKKKEKWILILDNADEITVPFETQVTSQKTQVSGSNDELTQSLLAYLPQSQNDSILVTTRTKSVGLRLAEESDVISIESINNTHALTLLERKLEKQIDKDDTSKLTAALEFMSLVIVQAAAYIRQRTSRYSIRQYVEDFYKNDKKKISLLNHEAKHLRRNQKTKNSIIII